MHRHERLEGPMTCHHGTPHDCSACLKGMAWDPYLASGTNRIWFDFLAALVLVDRFRDWLRD